MFNERPYYVRTEDYLPGLRQHLFFKVQGNLKHWATYNDLSVKRHNSRTTARTDPECPEDGENWQPPTRVTCLDDKDPVTTTKPKTTTQTTAKPSTTTKPITTKPTTTKPIQTTKKPTTGKCELKRKQGECEPIDDQCNMKAIELSNGVNEGKV